MSITAPVVTLSPRDYDAFLFDLDGVLTKTASVHAVAWKKLFDGFLQERAERTGEAFLPFDIDADYRRYVDGKPRYAEWQRSSNRVELNCLSERPKTAPASKPCTGSAI